MVFLHWQLMPGFRTQHQWYTFEKPVRIRVVEDLTKHGNVKYVFSGHVHNGIMVTARSAWEYKGTRFIVVPTCIAPKSNINPPALPVRIYKALPFQAFI